MSALIFVRDGRTLPFVPVTIAALAALRATCAQPRDDASRRSYPHALAAYMALLELANEGRDSHVAVTQKDLAERAGASRATIQRAMTDLEAAGLLEVNERHHGPARIENEYVIREPQELAPSHQREAGVASQGGGSRGRGPSAPSEPQGETTEEGRKEARDARPPAIAHKLPDDLPESLHEPAIAAGRILHRAAKARGQTRVVLLEAVGRAVGNHPTKDPVEVAGRIEHWLCWGNGQGKPCKDIVARFRDWLADSPDVRLADGSPLAEVGHPPGVTPIRRDKTADREARYERRREAFMRSQASA